MRNIFRTLFITLIVLVVYQSSTAREYMFGEFKSTESIKSTAAGCGAPSGFRFLQINNVRGRINTGGDMWWDLPGGIGAQYFVPANGSATSLFSGSLWIGGLDINNQLKLAGLRYRQVGQDYWTGPLTIDGTAAIGEDECAKWDRFFVTTRAEIDEFIQWYTSDNKAEDFPGYTIPRSITEYPAHGDISKGQSYYMAPFKDVDGDGDYDPNSGDYPYYDLTNELCPLNYAGDPNYVPTPTMESELYEDYFGGILVDQVLKGDETMWWVFNDKGNFHSETNGAAIGMEIRAQAFAFATNDEINNMTFYSYEIINRSTYVLTQTYFSPWVDTDLGYAQDDYVGCDVNRGLGYCYNGTPVDGGGEPEAYGDQPPAIGIDFFQGPYMDPDTCDNPSYFGDGLLGPTINDCSIVNANGAEIFLTYGVGDTASGYFKVRSEAINGVNFGNGIVDDERFGMRRFVYHNNTGGVQGDPQIAPEYYNYLRGIWRDNSRMLYGGNAHNSNPGALGPECDFMFPGDTDPCNWGTQGQLPNGGLNQEGNYWTEEEVGNNPFDRRFMQSAGPFTLKPGAVNYITVGIPWARAISGGPWASVQLLRVVDDKCQALFDNCFKVINGPDAPDLTFREMNNELIVYISNSRTSNNYKESYQELDPQIKAQTPDSLIGTGLEYDPYYRFEGYLIFQLKDATVTLSESRYDANKVRLVAQFDVKNRVGKIVNYNFDQAIGANVPVIEVEGGDNGISHSFRLFEDAFATDDRTLVNHKQYYYSVIAYGYNNFKEYDQTDPLALDGQKKPYLSGRKNIQLYTAIPHQSVNGVVMNGSYGDGPQVTRLEGKGNGGQEVDWSQESMEELFSKSPAGITADGDTVNYGDPNYPIVYQPVYQYGRGPINIKVIDPLNVKAANYLLKFDTIFYHYTYERVTGTEGLAPGGDTVGVNATPRWWLIDENTGNQYMADTSTNLNYEQLFPDLGISITIGPVFNAGPSKIGETNNEERNPVYEFFADNNGLINSAIVYADSSRRWLSGVPDDDIPFSSLNWIRSGAYRDPNNPQNDDWNMPSNPWDPDEAFEKIIGGTWAPYCMCAYDNQDDNGAAPAYGTQSTSKSQSGGLKELSSVDIVLTSDKTKWTRSAVLEMCPEPILAEGGATRFNLRKSPSLDKDGNAAVQNAEPTLDPNDPAYILPYGMSWFPGYAVNLETGERLNIMFGEDSWLVGENGRDMLFNPTSSLLSAPYNDVLFGGKHYVYVMRSGEFLKTYGQGGQDTLQFKFPAYDACKALVDVITFDTIQAIEEIYRQLCFASTMYVGIPLSDPQQEWLSNNVTIKIRIAKPYERYFAAPLKSGQYEADNDHYPMYRFSTEGIATSMYNEEKAKQDLDLINVVPNPYYAFAVAPGYERSALDTRVKITNLPESCTVTIYNVSGTLIRQYTKDDPVTYLDWDLKNYAGIPIAGGVYMIHVKDNITGEQRILKWFGSLRVEDFKQF
ncbi:MAG: T9SS type A sorting domain-containing protein [Bacteroidales bacterium]|nr:T9SS type A sorting domain-containing protein [Bacteroidales bacterium]